MTLKYLSFIAAVSTLSLFAAGCGNSSTIPPQNQAATPGQQAAALGQNGGQRRGGAGMMNVPAGSKAFFGTVATVNGTTLTLTGRNATTTVDLLPTTEYTSSTQADIKVDTRIMGYGTANADGSIAAQTVRLAPSMAGGRGRAGGGFRNGGAPGGPQDVPPAPPQGQ